MTKVLLVLHAVGAVGLLGSSTHAAVLAVRQLVGLPARPKLQRLYAKVTGALYLVTFTLGLLVYPAFRVDVRAAYFDAELPLATGFFEVKEHWLGLGLLALAAYYGLSRRHDPKSGSPEAWAHAILAITLAALVWFGSLTGFALTALRPV